MAYVKIFCTFLDTLHISGVEIEGKIVNSNMS